VFRGRLPAAKLMNRLGVAYRSVELHHQCLIELCSRSNATSPSRPHHPVIWARSWLRELRLAPHAERARPGRA